MASTNMNTTRRCTSSGWIEIYIRPSTIQETTASFHRPLPRMATPLDILILGDAPTFPGCVFAARPVGLFEMLDQGVLDEKVLAYATGNPRFSSIQNYKDVQQHILLEVEHFFSIYKDLEHKRTQVLGWKDRETAHEVIRSSHQRYLEKKTG